MTDAEQKGDAGGEHAAKVAQRADLVMPALSPAGRCVAPPGGGWAALRRLAIRPLGVALALMWVEEALAQSD